MAGTIKSRDLVSRTRAVAIRIWCAAPSQWLVFRAIRHAWRHRSFSSVCWLLAYERAAEQKQEAAHG